MGQPVPGADQLRVIIDAIPAAVAYVDRDQYFRVVNRAFRELHAPAFGELVGHHLRDVLGPAGYEVMAAHVDRVLRGEPVSYAARMPMRDGRVRWIQASFMPDRDGDQVVGFVTELHDVTAQKQIEERVAALAEASKALVACRDRAAALTTIANVAIPALADWAAVYVRSGDGFEAVEVAHAPYLARDQIWQLVRQLEPVAADAPTPLGFAKGSGISIGLVARGRQLGALVLGSLHGHRWNGDDLVVLEELGRRSSAALDTAILIEQQRRALDRLEDADRRKDHFLAVLGHELRNPLAPIVTALDLMAFRGAGHEREREVIRRQTAHMTRLVDDLLDVSRITRGKIELQREPLDLADVVAKAVELASPLIEQRQHQLQVDVPRGLTVDADPVRLAQVFTNLIANAAKYTQLRGRITVRAETRADTLAVIVADNGPGIPAELVATVFEPFEQGKSAVERAQGGLGLGLALVRSLAMLHGGGVSLDTDATGSRFMVTLPRASGPALTAGAGRLLVVDDNIDAATLLAELLRTIGYDVAVAHDAPEALAIASEFRPSIALLDLGLPRMDGYELARHLRRQLPEPPRLVAVTGFGQDPDLQRSRAAGFEVQLAKPVDFDQLVSVLGQLAS
jgi:PAS domain S-box-containing protein